LAAAGDPAPDVESDRQIQARAIALIRQHPWRHLALIPLNLWWGGFFSFPALVLILVDACRRRNYDLVVMALPAFASLLFFASVAHLEPRFSIPSYPIILCALVALACRYRQRFTAGSVFKMTPR